MDDLLRQLNTLQRIDLAQPMRIGMPHWPTHPPYTHSLTRLHGDLVHPGGASSASDAISLGTHTGTHVDALSHFSLHGCLHDGSRVDELQEYARGIEGHGVDQLGLTLARCVLLDAAPDGVLQDNAGIGAAELECAERASRTRVRAGDVVLIRTGWGAKWASPRLFLNGQRQPGVTLDGARWLGARGVAMAGSDTIAFERTPAPGMEVHAHLLVECSVPILECLQLEGLARWRAHEALFVLSPLKLAGATASPARPWALVGRQRDSLNNG